MCNHVGLFELFLVLGTQWVRKVPVGGSRDGVIGSQGVWGRGGDKGGWRQRLGLGGGEGTQGTESASPAATRGGEGRGPEETWGEHFTKAGVTNSMKWAWGHVTSKQERKVPPSAEASQGGGGGCSGCQRIKRGE